MKKLVLSITVVTLMAGFALAQNNTGKADDGSRIAITPQVNDQDIPQAAKNLLLTKMKQICTKNGLAGDSENPFFIMDATIDVLAKELTATAPPMHALNMQLSLSIKDAYTGNVYSETSVELKGVGQNETKAYMAGLQTVNAANGQFKAMVDKGKEKITEFYNSQCDFVVSKATAFQKQGNNRDAIKVLKSVPPVCKECYDKCMGILATIPQPADAGIADPGTIPEPVVGAGEHEIDNGIFMVYAGGAQQGGKTVLNFELHNRTNADFKFTDYNFDTRAVDGNGKEFVAERIVCAGSDGANANATIVSGAPVKLECIFGQMSSIAMFEYKYKEILFRFKNLPIAGSSSATTVTTTAVTQTAPTSTVVVTAAVPAAAAAAAGTQTQNATVQVVAATPVVTTTNMLVGDVVLAYFGDDDFYQKRYLPAKVQTLPSAATKNQTQMIVVNDETPDNTWTTDIITKWHKAASSELRDGVIVIYTDYEPEIKSVYYPGIVVMTDELYKGIVSIKGRWGNIHKVEVTKIAIVDAPAFGGPAN